MAGASKLNTSHQHHYHGRNSMVQPIVATLSHRWGGPIFPCLLSLFLFLFIFLFFYCSLIYGWKFLFLLLTCLWVWGFGFFLGFNDLEKEGILIWVWRWKKERIFVSSFGCSKGCIFGLDMAMFLCWDFWASGFLWLDVCVMCFM